MTEWFARPVLHVTDVDASVRFYVNRHMPEKIGKGLMFISMHVGQETREAAIAAQTVPGATGSWWSMIPTAISSSSTIRTRLQPAVLPVAAQIGPPAPPQPASSFHLSTAL